MAKKRSKDDGCDDPRKGSTQPQEAAGEIPRVLDGKLVTAGRQGFNDGNGVGDCPYGIGDTRRVDWFVGYYQAQTDRNVGHVLDKYNLGRMCQEVQS